MSSPRQSWGSSGALRAAVTSVRSPLLLRTVSSPIQREPGSFFVIVVTQSSAPSKRSTYSNDSAPIQVDRSRSKSGPSPVETTSSLRSSLVNRYGPAGAGALDPPPTRRCTAWT
jgi:hypothetical protein